MSSCALERPAWHLQGVAGGVPWPTEVAFKPTDETRIAPRETNYRVRDQGVGTRVSVSQKEVVVTLGLPTIVPSALLYQESPQGKAPAGGHRACPFASLSLSLLRTMPTKTQSRPAASAHCLVFSTMTFLLSWLSFQRFLFEPA